MMLGTNMVVNLFVARAAISSASIGFTAPFRAAEARSLRTFSSSILLEVAIASATFALGAGLEDLGLLGDALLTGIPSLGVKVVGRVIESSAICIILSRWRRIHSSSSGI